MPPNPLSDHSIWSLLKALDCEESFVFLETTKVTHEEHRSYVFMRPVDRLVCRRGEDPAIFFNQAEKWLQKGFYLAGWVGYEFGYLLEPSLAAFSQSKPADFQTLAMASLFVFPHPYTFDHCKKSFGETGSWPTVDVSSEEKPGYAVSSLRLNMEESDYLERFRTIKSYIEAGDTYQVNYTLKYKFDFFGSIPSFYTTLRRNQSVSYGAFLKEGKRQVLSFSPELFFRKKGATLTVRPMKGTIHRGRTVNEDREMINFLKADIKTRSENVMIVDLLRNDLGRLSRLKKTGGVVVKSLFDVETYETLHQMTSTIQGRLRPDALDVSMRELFSALFPCGSVTGAPKIRTMEIIRDLEKEDRGVYTGAIGYCAPDGEAVFNVPIRTIVLDGRKGEMGIGSGIVYDSDPHKEWEECKLKARFLTEPLPDFKLIETMLWRPTEGFSLLDLHLDRLSESACYFGFPMDREELNTILQKRADTFSHDRRVRLTLARDGTVDITDMEYTGPAADSDTMPVPRVMLSEKRTDSRSPYLFHKTTVRTLYDEERQKALAAGYVEVLFQNERGEVTEGSITNIFIKKDGLFKTPPVECGLLEGVFRKHFMASHQNNTEEAILTEEDLKQADAVYVCNSVQGIVRVELVCRQR